MATIEITILSGVSAGDVFRFDLSDVPGNGSQSFTIGRSPECELVLQESTVSRRHATVARRAGVFLITALGSSNGTHHMGFPLRPGDDGARKLSTGDEFKISDMLFRVNIPDERPAVDKKADGADQQKHKSTAAMPRPRRSKLIR